MPYFAPIDTSPISEIVATATVSTSPSLTINVSSLPAGDLELFYSMRSSSTETIVQITLNGVTSGYNSCWSRINTSPTLSGSGLDGSGVNFIQGSNAEGFTGTSPIEGYLTIPNYKTSGIVKTLHSSLFVDPSSANRHERFGGILPSLTAPITSLTFTVGVDNVQAGSFLRARVIV